MDGTRPRIATRSLLAALAAGGLIALAPAGASAARSPVPDDPALPAQWPLSGGALGVRDAWRVTTGAGTVVAIVDTGVQLDHPDLAANLWTNPGEIAGNGIDDDANGYVDDVHGWDFAENDADPSDDNGHGTHVAGIVAARGNNRTGVAGVAWRARLMAVRALGRDGSGSVGAVARAVRYAVANGARIVNLSMAGPDDAPELESAIADAGAAGVLVVAAAGNTGADLDVRPSFPAASPAANVIAVASTDVDGALAVDSSFGAATVDLAAPGEEIDSTERRGRYGSRSGTSQAAAHVTGVLALMAAAAPRASGPDLRGALLGGARPGRLPVAAGSLDAAAAVRAVAGLPQAGRRGLPRRAAARPSDRPATPPPAARRAAARRGGALRPTRRGLGGPRGARGDAAPLSAT